MLIENCSTIIPQNPPPNRRVAKLSSLQESFQLELFPLPKPLSKQHQKPQIQSIPGVSVREQYRYRVVIGDAILANKLTIDEAIALVKKGKRR